MFFAMKALMNSALRGLSMLGPQCRVWNVPTAALPIGLIVM